MDPYVAPFLREIEDLRRQTVEMVTPLDDEKINRTVPGLRNTVGIVLRHMSGSMRYWIGEVVGGRPARRDRDAEFGHDPLRKNELLSEFDRVVALARDILEHLLSPELLREVDVQRPQAGGKETKGYAVIHATQHLAYHVGQLRCMIRLFERGV
jgi:uncharacterized damage-inducible protein DinB